MAILRAIPFIVVVVSTTCQAITGLTGPKVLLLTPRHGEPYQQHVQISLHVEIGEVLDLFLYFYSVISDQLSQVT
jgi:hypothetical protein